MLYTRLYATFFTVNCPAAVAGFGGEEVVQSLRTGKYINSMLQPFPLDTSYCFNLGKDLGLVLVSAIALLGAPRG